jgi:hypothetical protein
MKIKLTSMPVFKGVLHHSITPVLQNSNCVQDLGDYLWLIRI